MSNQYKLDLHTHSIISYDGGLNIEQYRKILDDGFVVAITDHNEISFAQEAQREFGNKVIVGEEILTQDGEVIGLFLTQKIEPGLSLDETIKKIKQQNGLVYIPHPFEITRKGVSQESLTKVASSIDILEVYNARNREPWLSRKADEFAGKHNTVKAAASDAHGLSGIGTSYSLVSNLPTRDNVINLLQTASLYKKHAPLLSLLHPFFNKLKKLI